MVRVFDFCVMHCTSISWTDVIITRVIIRMDFGVSDVKFAPKFDVDHGDTGL